MFLDGPRLSRKAVDNIAAAERMVFVSPASLWEIAIKISLGKYKLPEDFEQFWDYHCCRGGCMPDSLEDTKREVEGRPSMKKILSIDGGGIRGLIPALVLAEIENRTGKAVADCFDLIAGTSTADIWLSDATAEERDTSSGRAKRFKFKSIQKWQ